MEISISGINIGCLLTFLLHFEYILIESYDYILIIHLDYIWWITSWLHLDNILITSSFHLDYILITSIPLDYYLIASNFFFGEFPCHFYLTWKSLVGIGLVNPLNNYITSSIYKSMDIFGVLNIHTFFI